MRTEFEIKKVYENKKQHSYSIVVVKINILQLSDTQTILKRNVNAIF